eukprot:scaffold6116_cov145-Skeletonema_menzelii.AAC.1
MLYLLSISFSKFKIKRRSFPCLLNLNACNLNSCLRCSPYTVSAMKLNQPSQSTSFGPSLNPSSSINPSPTPSEVPSVSSEPSLDPSSNPTVSIDPSFEPSGVPSVSSEPSMDPKQSQLYALSVLYNATNGDSWDNNSGWLDSSSQSECDWYGVTCDDENIVTSVELGFNNLSGSIPTEIGLLKSL